MTPEEILSHAPRVLSQAQRESYFEHGYVMVESLISEDWLARLNRTTEDYLERSRTLRESDDIFDLAPGHCAERPKVRRLKAPDLDPVYWEFANDVIADVAADLVGPDVTFHHSKLNFKWPTDSESNSVDWHQDITFYPHTNYNVLAIGTYLQDTTDDDGPLLAMPDSHNGPLYEHFDDACNWTGHLRPEDAARLNETDAVSLPGPRGSITVHSARTVHASRPSRAARLRPLLINAYAAADAFPYTFNSSHSHHNRTQVRGQPARWAHHDVRPCPIPPDWSQGYQSIYAAQAGESAHR